jgi:SAM-dependent methyltransferase
MSSVDPRYEGESFGGIFSSSSIEHFGEFDDVARSVQEIARVLRPAGVATVSMEFRIEGAARTSRDADPMDAVESSTRWRARPIGSLYPFRSGVRSAEGS